MKMLNRNRRRPPTPLMAVAALLLLPATAGAFSAPFVRRTVPSVARSGSDGLLPRTALRAESANAELKADLLERVETLVSGEMLLAVGSRDAGEVIFACN